MCGQTQLGAVVAMCTMAVGGRIILGYAMPAARKTGIRVTWLVWGLTGEDLANMSPAVLGPQLAPPARGPGTTGSGATRRASAPSGTVLMWGSGRILRRNTSSGGQGFRRAL